MSDVRPLPEMQSTTPPPRSERIRGWGTKGKLAWYNSMIFVAANKKTWMLLVQLLGALAVLVGISFWSIPAALIVGGIGAILVMERQ